MKNSQEADFPLQEKQSQMEPDRVQQTLQMDRQEIQLAERDEWHFCRAEVTKYVQIVWNPLVWEGWIAFQDDTEKLCNFSVTVLS